MRSCFGRIVSGTHSDFGRFAFILVFYRVAAHVGQILSYLSPLHHVEV